MGSRDGHIELDWAVDAIVVGTRHRTDLGDIDALALAVDDALTLDRGLVRRRAEDHCSDIAMIDRYLDLYADLVAGRPLADSSLPREVGV